MSKHEQLLKQVNQEAQREEKVETTETMRKAIDPEKADPDKNDAPGIRKGEDPLTSRPYAYNRAIRGLMYGWEKSKVEREVHDSLCRSFGPPLSPTAIYVPLNVRAMSEGTESAGGYLVNPEYANEIIELLRDNIVVAKAGAQTRTLPKSGLLNIPTRTGKSTGYWIGEGNSITASDLAYGTLPLSAKKLAAFVVVSNELIADSTPGVEADVRNDLTLTLSETQDLAFLQGTGQNNQPTGITVNANRSTYTLAGDSNNGASPDFDDLYNMIYKLQSVKGDPGKAAFIMHPRTLQTLVKLKDNTDQYMFQPDVSQKTAGTIWGIPVYFSTQVSITQTKGTSNGICSYIILGQFDQAIIAQHMALEIEADRSILFQNDQTAIRAITRVDFGLRQPTLFVHTNGVLV